MNDTLVALASSKNGRYSFATTGADHIVFLRDGRISGKHCDRGHCGFSLLGGLDVNNDGIVVVADMQNHRIVKVDLDGATTTLAGGNGEGFRDGEKASFNFPTSVAWMADGSVAVADGGNSAVRIIHKDGDVSTVAGGILGNKDGDAENDSVRLIEDGHVRTITGDEEGYQDGHVGLLRRPMGVTVLHDGSYAVADTGNFAVRHVTCSGYTRTIVRDAAPGSGPTDVARFNGDVAVAWGTSRPTFFDPNGSHVAVP